MARDVERPSEWVGQIAAYVTVRIVDTTGKTLTEPGWIQFSTSPNDTLSVRDNTAKDLDGNMSYHESAGANGFTVTFYHETQIF